MRAAVRFRLPDGSIRTLGPGDLVGRLASAQLRLEDASISEAHALVSLRGSELHLLALRGRFAVDGEPSAEVALSPGQHIQLSREIAVSVEAVELPAEVLALEGEGVPRCVLSGVVSIRAGDPPEIVRRFVDGADVWLWDGGDGWRMRVRDGATVIVEPGVAVPVGGRVLRVVAVALAAAGLDATRMRGGLDAPLLVRARFDSVHLLRDGEAPLVLSGQPARIVSELVTIGVAVGWEDLARTVFPDAEDTWDRRRKWDQALLRLRRKLREGNVRPDLVRADGAGNFELVLGPHDRVEDQS